MKKKSLIIDLRNQMPWHKRYVSHTTTAMLWAVWLLLWRPLMLIVGIIGVQKPQLLQHFIDVSATIVENGFVALIGCAISLWLWSNYASTKSIKSAEQKDIEDYAAYFSMPIEDLEQSRHDKIVTVHHNAEGQIIRIDSDLY